MIPCPSQSGGNEALCIIFQIGRKCLNNRDKFGEIWYIKPLAAFGGV